MTNITPIGKNLNANAMLVMCDCCGEQTLVTGIYRREYDQWKTFGRKISFEERFPKVSDEGRDLILTGVCEDCWERAA